MSNNLDITIISERYWKATQSLDAELICVRNADNMRFKARIKRDAYDMQSFLNISCWTNNGWTFVSQLPITFYTLSKYNYTMKDNSWQEAARKDINDALDEAFKIVPWSKQ